MKLTRQYTLYYYELPSLIPYLGPYRILMKPETEIWSQLLADQDKKIIQEHLQAMGWGHVWLGTETIPEIGFGTRDEAMLFKLGSNV